MNMATSVSRNEILMQARQATADAPVSQATYSDYELGQRLAMRDALEALRDLSEVWRVENERAVARRKQLAREAVALAYLQAKARKPQPEIVTSAPALQAPARKVNPLADTVVIPFEQPFPLCRPILRGKVAPKRRATAIGNFFRTVNIFLKG
jgi:hypothetical protein